MLLRDVIATELLSLRQPAVRPEVATVLAPFERLGRCSEAQVWDAVCEHALHLCHGQSAGVSIFADVRYDELTWVSATGALAEFRMRRFPQRHSLCGVVFDRKSPQLFVEPHRYFKWIAQAGVTIDESLVVPLVAGDRMYGTLWVMTHQPVHCFSASDEAMLAMLGEAATQYVALHHRGGPVAMSSQSRGRPVRAGASARAASMADFIKK